jgi:hypothetical protein
MGRILLRVKRLAFLLLLSAGCAGAGVQVKNACPESRSLYCGSNGYRCTDDAERACKVCVCEEGPKLPGGVPPRPPLSNQPPPR